MGEKKFSYDIQLNTTDIWWFSLYHSNRGFMGIFNLLFTVTAVYSLIVGFTSLSLTQKAIFCIMALLFSVIQPLILYMKARKQAKSDTIKKGIHIDICEEGIVVSQEENKAEFAWENVFKVMPRGKMIILYIDTVRGYILPQRDIKEDREEILAFLSGKVRVRRW